MSSELDFETIIKKINQEMVEFRKNPVLNIQPQLEIELRCADGAPQCPFCDVPLFIEHQSMLVCKKCPYGYYITSFSNDLDNRLIDISKFTITFGNTAARVAQVFSENKGVIIFQRVDDLEVLSNITQYDMKLDSNTTVQFDKINFNFKDPESIINKLKTYLTFC
jgi:hypothetical protein